ncbi:hypothetical protein KSP40_PGU017833 [Platanthera guangdongensis]|uniref:Mei2-like C-terminal RNA recognition motif domain-containing protein n=1 Tax=Platanthera guangdongensis TaxID=2320717 RepID=A0ABR2MH97_9ASPA
MAAALNPAAPIFIPTVGAAVADSFLPIPWYQLPPPPPPPPLFTSFFTNNLSFSKSSVLFDGSLFYYQTPSLPLPQQLNNAYYSCYFPPAKNSPPAAVGTEAVQPVKEEKSYHTGKGWRGHHGCRQFIGRSFGPRMCWVPKASSGEKRRIPVNRRCTEEDFEFKEEVEKDGFGGGSGGAGRSTVMIKNIPNKLSKPQIMELLDDHCRRENHKIQKEAVDSDLTEFDFLYLPMDFISGNNLGYAFVNYTNPAAARKLHRDLHMKPWSHCGSRKICEGVEELVKHFRHSIFCCSSAEYLPVFFKPSRDGFRASTEQLIGKFAACSV